MAELDIRIAALQAKTMARYVEGFTRDVIQGFGEKNAREFLGKTLDHLQETAAMLGNVADRLALTAPVATEQVVAAGWKLVPAEPTEAMIEAGCEAGDGISEPTPTEMWSAMLAASPEAAPAAMDVTPKKTDAEAYIELAEAMGYPGGDACMLSPEEWAADLLRDAKLNRAAATPAATSAASDAYSDPACQRAQMLNRQWDSGFEAGGESALAQPAPVQQDAPAPSMVGDAPSALDFRCTYCDSQPGVPCVGTMSGTHVQRREALAAPTQAGAGDAKGGA